MKTRRAEQAEGTRTALLEAARPLFAERGFAAVGTEEIVAAAKLTRGALYYHFDDKRDLFRAVFADVDRELVERVARVALEQDDPWDALVAGCEAFLDACVDPALQRIVFLDAPSVLGWREWTAAGEAASALSVIEAGLSAAAQAGVLRIDDVRVFAHLVLGALNEAGMFIAHADDPDRARRQVGASLLQLLEGLRAAN